MARTLHANDVILHNLNSKWKTSETILACWVYYGKMHRTFTSFTSRSGQHPRPVLESSKTKSPVEIVRSIVSDAVAPDPLPPTVQFEVHYIRGLSGSQVAFTPEFLYMLDTGLPSIAGV